MYKEISKKDIISNIKNCKHRSDLIRKLGLPTNGSSNYYIKTLIDSYGIDENDYYNIRSNTSGLQQISKESLQKIVYESSTYKEVLEKLGYKNVVGSSYRVLKDKIVKLGIDISQMTHYKPNHNYTYTDEEVFNEQSRVQQSCLRNRVLKNKLIPYECNICGNMGEWNGKPLTLTLDHINGNRLDNRKCNLRICTQSTNQMNVNYKGIYPKNDKWIAKIKINQKQIHLGIFIIKEAALYARWFAEKTLFKEFAYPKEEPNILQSRKKEIQELVNRKVQRL